jgi:hypothetical protein
VTPARTWTLLLALSALLSAAWIGASALATQDPPAKAAPLCAKCKSTGRQFCPEHDKERDVLPHEDNVWFCSVLADCATCGGTGFIDCPFCDNPAPGIELAKRRERIARERPALEHYDTEMRRKLRKCSTQHFTLVWEIDSMKVDKVPRAGHELMHIYAERLEQIYKDYTEILHVSPSEFQKRGKVFVWWLVNEQRDASQRFCGQVGDTGVKLMGSDIAYSVCGYKQYFNGDEQLHRNIAHCIAHLLFSHQEPQMWVGNQKAGWAEEGLGHWFEDRYFGICDNYCFEEQNNTVYFKSGKYKLAVRKMVAEGNAPSVSEVLQLNSDQLSPAQNAIAFSIVDYLIFLDGAKFSALGKKLRKRVGSREALAQVYQLSPLTLEAAWKAWVLETYPKQ